MFTLLVHEEAVLGLILAGCLFFRGVDLLLLSLIKLVKVDSEGSAFNFKIPAKTLNPFNKLSRL